MLRTLIALALATTASAAGQQVSLQVLMGHRGASGDIDGLKSAQSGNIIASTGVMRAAGSNGRLPRAPPAPSCFASRR